MKFLSKNFSLGIELPSDLCSPIRIHSDDDGVNFQKSFRLIITDAKNEAAQRFSFRIQSSLLTSSIINTATMTAIATELPKNLGEKTDGTNVFFRFLDGQVGLRSRNAILVWSYYSVSQSFVSCRHFAYG